jgi:hypothetical protein
MSEREFFSLGKGQKKYLPANYYFTTPDYNGWSKLFIDSRGLINFSHFVQDSAISLKNCLNFWQSSNFKNNHLFYKLATSLKIWRPFVLVFII